MGKPRRNILADIVGYQSPDGPGLNVSNGNGDVRDILPLGSVTVPTIVASCADAEEVTPKIIETGKLSDEGHDAWQEKGSIRARTKTFFFAAISFDVGFLAEDTSIPLLTVTEVCEASEWFAQAPLHIDGLHLSGNH